MIDYIFKREKAYAQLPEINVFILRYKFLFKDREFLFKYKVNIYNNQNATVSKHRSLN
jgi:hypothetical protein